MADIITTLHPEGAPEDDLYPNIKKENLPSVIKGDELWENGDPRAEFASQTISVPGLENYEYLVIEFKMDNGSSEGSRFFKFRNYMFGVTEYRDERFSIEYGSRIYYRSLTVLENSSISIGDGEINGTASNTAMIPVAIYGTPIL